MTFREVPSEAWEEAGRGACQHVRRKSGEGQDGDVTVEAWECEVCGDTFIERVPA